MGQPTEGNGGPGQTPVEAPNQNQPPVEGTDPNVTPTVPTPPVQPPSNPAPYAEYLEQLPESVRPLVEPVFKEWDAGVTQKFQELHSQFEPYQEIAQNFQPEDVQVAIQLAQVMEADPEGFWRSLGEAYGLSPEQGPGTQQGGPQGGGQQQTPQVNTGSELPPLDPDDPYAARFAQFDQMGELVNMLAQAFLQQNEQSQQNENSQALDQAMNDLKTKHGDFDEVYVLTLIGNGLDPEQAHAQWVQSIQQYAPQGQPNGGQQPPVVMGSGGGLPTTQIDASKLDSSETKNLVAQILQAAAQENQ